MIVLDLDTIEHVLRWAAGDRVAPPVIPQSQAELALSEFLRWRAIFRLPVDTSVDI